MIIEKNYFSSYFAIYVYTVRIGDIRKVDEIIYVAEKSYIKYINSTECSIQKY